MKKITNLLIGVLSIFTMSHTLYAASNDASSFSGKWYAGNAKFSKEVTIKPLTNNSFKFNFSSVRGMGASFGEIDGTAQMSGENKAVFKGENNCELIFELKQDILQVQDTEGCSYYGGFNITFNGNLKHK